jgi:hypothetical protein
LPRIHLSVSFLGCSLHLLSLHTAYVLCLSFSALFTFTAEPASFVLTPFLSASRSRSPDFLSLFEVPYLDLQTSQLLHQGYPSNALNHSQLLLTRTIPSSLLTRWKPPVCSPGPNLYPEPLPLLPLPAKYSSAGRVRGYLWRHCCARSSKWRETVEKLEGGREVEKRDDMASSLLPRTRPHIGIACSLSGINSYALHKTMVASQTVPKKGDTVRNPLPWQARSL